MTEPQPAPGTAGLYDLIQALQAELRETRVQLETERASQAKLNERRRARLLCFVDEDEQALGYGQQDRLPRTAEIRRYWRAQGSPEVRSKNAG